MTIDEAKAHGELWLSAKILSGKADEFVRLALWLMGREPLVQKLASPSGTWDGDAQRLKQWEREHPRPGS